jgi:outer membrane receptor protein involved in Fe transport
VERRFLANKISLDATWFHNDFRDLIVSLGGSLSKLSTYYTDNLGHARAEGAELTARVRPASWILLTGNYTWLETAVLALNGGSGLVQQYFYLRQPLLRQPKQSGSMMASLQRGRADVVVAGYWRGHTLDVEPSYGAFGGLYRNPGYVTFNLTVNFRLKGNLTAYANLHNALDRRYEEIFGFPSPLLNVVAGLKWNLARAR